MCNMKRFLFHLNKEVRFFSCLISKWKKNIIFKIFNLVKHYEGAYGGRVGTIKRRDLEDWISEQGTMNLKYYLYNLFFLVSLEFFF